MRTFIFIITLFLFLSLSQEVEARRGRPRGHSSKSSHHRHSHNHSHRSSKAKTERTHTKVKKDVKGEVKLLKTKLSLSNKGFSKKEALDLLSHYTPQLTTCYQDFLLSNLSFKGKVVIEWDVQQEGSVSNLNIPVESTFLQGCLSDVFKTISFPRNKQGKVTSTYLFKQIR